MNILSISGLVSHSDSSNHERFDDEFVDRFLAIAKKTCSRLAPFTETMKLLPADKPEDVFIAFLAAYEQSELPVSPLRMPKFAKVRLHSNDPRDGLLFAAKRDLVRFHPMPSIFPVFAIRRGWGERVCMFLNATRYLQSSERGNQLIAEFLKGGPA